MLILRLIHPSWIFYTIVAGAISGVLLGISAEFTLAPNLIALALLTPLIILTLRLPCLLTGGVAFVIGITLGIYRVYPVNYSRDFAANLVNQTVTITGQLTDDPDTSKGSPVIHLRKLIFIPSADNPINLSGELYVTLSSGAPDLERSDFITITGKFSEGFGTFLGKIFRPEINSISRSEPGDIFARFKHGFSDQVRNLIPSPEVDLGLGYLMGMKSGLSTEFSEALSAVGMTHVVVASGAHLAILTGAARKLFGKISKFAGLLFSLLMIGAFLMIVGFTPSMTRAALVSSLSLLVGYVGRQFTPLRLISFTAMLTLFIDPNNFLNLGWQLSFASFFAILVVAPRLQKTFYGGKRPPWLASMLITSISASLICAPILVYNFGSLSFLSLFANLIILPTLPYTMLGMVLTGTASFASIISSPFAWLTTKLLDLHIWLINFLSEKTMFIINPPSGNAFIFLFYLPILAYLFLPKVIKLRQARSTRLTPHVEAS